MEEAAIDIKALEKTIAEGFWGRPKRLLHGLTLQVRAGQVYGFVGQNGAGKSTTIQHLIGALRPTRGMVQIFGWAPTAVQARRLLGYLPETPRLPANLTPAELLAHHARLLGMSSPERKQAVEQRLHEVDVVRFAQQRIKTLSKGNQQRVALALALLGAPKLLVLDEPMSGLDPGGRRLVRQLIRRERDRGTTIFFSSHVLSDVESLCDEVALLHEGRLLLHGSVDSVLRTEPQMWVVEFDGPATKDVVEQARQPADSIDGQRHIWRFSDPQEAWNQANSLRSRGIDVHRIEREHHSLEDRVLDLLKLSPNPLADPPLSPPHIDSLRP